MSDSEASIRGYESPRRMRQKRARKAGLESGRRRRERADPRRRRVQQRELALKFPVRLVDRAEFERRDLDRRAQLGIGISERGTETLWQEYLSCVRAYKAQGQGFLTTNGQRAQALRKRGRPRCERTVQRSHQALAQMGLLRRFHDRRGGSRAGNRDRLRVQLVPSFVTPPSAAQAASQSDTAACASNDQVSAGDAGREGTPAAPASTAPPDGGIGGGERQGTVQTENGNGSDKGEGSSDVAESDSRLRQSVQHAERVRRLRALEEEGALPGSVQDLRRDGGRP